MTNPSQPIAELSWFDAEGRIHETPLEPGPLWNNSGSRWISDELGIEFNLEAEETELLRTVRLSRDSIREHGRNRLRTITLLPSRLAAAEGEEVAVVGLQKGEILRQGLRSCNFLMPPDRLEKRLRQMRHGRTDHKVFSFCHRLIHYRLL